MNRRVFVRDSLAGFAGLSSLAKSSGKSAAMLADQVKGGHAGLGGGGKGGEDGQRLFPTNLPSREWVQFQAAGFSQPACGVIYRHKDEVPFGMPLGGVSTGYLNIENNGTLGLCTFFNSGVPVGEPLRTPFLGINIGGRTCVLNMADMVGVEAAQEIHYWGHFPVLDMEFETRAPVSVAVRAWTPFIPGDVLASNIPAAVFEVRLRNVSSSPRKGTLAFNFSGPTQAEV